MKTTDVSRAALGRIPVYLRFLESLPQDTETVSATVIAKELGFGEVQVRKDLGGGHSRRGKARQSAARLQRIFRLRA